MPPEFFVLTSPGWSCRQMELLWYLQQNWRTTLFFTWKQSLVPELTCLPSQIRHGAHSLSRRRRCEAWAQTENSAEPYMDHGASDRSMVLIFGCTHRVRSNGLWRRKMGVR